jgi:hypothetical protein
VIAAALLAKTEHARLLVRDLRRARVHVAKPVTRNVGCCDALGPSKVAEMNTPYGLEIVESCLTCKLRKRHWFLWPLSRGSQNAECGEPS